MAGIQQALLARAAAAPSVRAPVAGYKLDNNSNDAVWSNNGTDTAITYWTSYGKINEWALFVRASASKIRLPSFNLNTASNPWSVQARIKTTTTFTWTDEWTVISRRTGTNTFQIRWKGSTSWTTVSLFDWWVTSTQLQSATINDWNWHHIVVTSSSNTSAKMYTDGSLTGSSTAFSFVTQTITNGNNIGNFDTWWRCWDWSIDEVFYRGVELTSTEVTALYNWWAWLAYPF